MATSECPLPEVAEALSRYIKPRGEVANIRRALQNYLQTQLQIQGISLSSVNLTDSYTSQIESPPPGLTGVRKAYWKALQAHNAAQAKYDALRTELDRLKHDKDLPTKSEDTQGSSASNASYIALLRQREKHRRLMVIDRALSEISSANVGNPPNNLDDMVRKKMGELPTPPSTQPSFTRNPEVELKLMELKKAVVSTKRRTEEQRSQIAGQPTNGALEVSTHAEVAGLQKALQELTIWMEKQLTSIADAEADAQSVQDSPLTNGTPAKPRISTEDIETLYENYLDARQRLIQPVSDSVHADSDPSIMGLELESVVSKGADASKIPKTSAESVLPYIPTLVAAKQEEQSALQQTAYIRRRLASAEEETDRVMRRLADESHLVQPGAFQGKDWVAAAKVAGAASNDFIKQRLVVGEASAGAAKETLDAIENLPKSLGPVAGRY